MTKHTPSEVRRNALSEIASAGLTPSGFGDLLLKSASTKRASVREFLSGASKVVGTMGDATLATAIGLPVVAGIAGGGVAHFLNQPNYNQILDEEKRQELLRELQLQTREARRRAGTSNIGNSRSPVKSFDARRPDSGQFAIG